VRIVKNTSCRGVRNKRETGEKRFKKPFHLLEKGEPEKGAIKRGPQIETQKVEGVIGRRKNNSRKEKKRPNGRGGRGEGGEINEEKGRGKRKPLKKRLHLLTVLVFLKKTNREDGGKWTSPAGVRRGN